MKTTKISKGVYKGDYKEVEFKVIASYWRGNIENWVGRIYFNCKEVIVVGELKKEVIQKIKIQIENN